MSNPSPPPRPDSWPQGAALVNGRFWDRFRSWPIYAQLPVWLLAWWALGLLWLAKWTGEPGRFLSRETRDLVATFGMVVLLGAGAAWTSVLFSAVASDPVQNTASAVVPSASSTSDSAGFALGESSDTPEPVTPSPTRKPSKREILYANQSALTREVSLALSRAAELKGETSSESGSLRDIRYYKTVDGRWGLEVSYDAHPETTADLTRLGIEIDMVEIYRSTYRTSWDISYVSVSAYLPLLDVYGNESDDVAYITRLDSDVEAQINWLNADQLDWSRLWSRIFAIRDFQ